MQQAIKMLLYHKLLRYWRLNMHHRICGIQRFDDDKTIYDYWIELRPEPEEEDDNDDDYD